jgi:L-lactate dehydrogenase complex protein LldG
MTAPDEARSMIFERIRVALGAERLDRARRSAVARRLERHPRGPLPARAKRQGEERVALFAAMLAKQGADVRRVATPKEAVGAVASYLGTCNLPPRVRLGKDRVLAGLPWREAWDIDRAFGAAEPDDRASLSRAVAGAAETGTLFLLSGSDNPTSLNFLPEAHSVLIAASDIFASYEELSTISACFPAASCRAASISSAGRRGPPISSRPSCAARTARAACSS